MNATTDESPRPAMRALTPLEARVLGVLFEKQHTVPDTYPLSLNSLASGCNQKTSRSPVMNVSESEIMDAINSLKRLSLVLEGSSSRVPRYEHNMERVLGLPRQSAALLTALLLRGSQTAAELRLATSRLHGFADTSSVEAFLEELAANDPPRVVKLARTPGERESRWTHLLCGEPSPELTRGAALSDEALPPGELESLRAQQQQLSERVERLEALVERLAGELGVSLDDPKGSPS
ncbi:YceH family protein [Paraburkholderia phymatum]|uniref:YceH family protein n=1 Tax=Paraburkholderia phymatum TaxID=148447 RepID=UPI00317CFDBA